MNLLIDTSGSRGQLAISESGKILSTTAWDKEGSHSEKITLELQQLLANTKADFAKLQSVSVVVGPGSFTGLRVGINCAKTIAYSQNLPIVGLNSLWALAMSYHQSGKTITSIIDAQRNSVFASRFSGNGEPEFENQIISISELTFPKDSLVCGSGWTRYQEILKDKCTFSGEWIRFESIEAQREKMTQSSWDQIQPLYIRKSAAEEKLS